MGLDLEDGSRIGRIELKLNGVHHELISNTKGLLLPSLKATLQYAQCKKTLQKVDGLTGEDDRKLQQVSS